MVSAATLIRREKFYSLYVNPEEVTAVVWAVFIASADEI